MNWFWVFLIIPFAWIYGRIHMSFVSKKERGKTTDKQLKGRAIYPITLVGTWAVYKVAQTSISNILTDFDALIKSMSILFAIGSVILCLLVMTLSYLDAIWYQRLAGFGAKKRMSFYYWVGLPILYGSLFLYWVLMFSLWAFFTTCFFNEFQMII